MGKKGSPKLLPSLEEQLRAHDEAAPEGPKYGWLATGTAKLEAPSSERMAWARKRNELATAILKRDGKRLDDPGRVGSSFAPSPYAQRGHKVEIAPKGLDKLLPKDSQYPKRVVTQRVIDRLRSRGTIGHAEWMAGTKLWEWWNLAITGDRLIAAYEPVTVHASPNTDRLVTKRMEAAYQYLGLMGMIPYRCRGVITHVVINDWDLSDWGRDRGFSSTHSQRRGRQLLSQGLSALAVKLGY